MLVVNSRVQIPLSELQFNYVRSSGPGGQNVNKVNSKAVLRWAIVSSSSLPDDVRARFVSKFSSRITESGEIIVSSQRFRDQGRNAGDCVDKLKAMLTEVANPPRKRKPTKPSRGAVERRLDKKRQQSSRKQGRRITSDD